MNWLQVICSVITILGGMWTMLKFLLKDMNKQLIDLEKEQELFRKEIKEINWKIDRSFSETNNRMDGLYHVLLNRTCGKNIPEELK